MSFFDADIRAFQRELPKCHGRSPTLYSNLGLQEWRIQCSVCGKDTGFFETREKARAAYFRLVGKKAVLEHYNKIHKI